MNPYTPRSDYHATSPCNSNKLSCERVMRANAFISQRELFRNKTKISFLIYKEKYDTK